MNDLEMKLNNDLEKNLNSVRRVCIKEVYECKLFIKLKGREETREKIDNLLEDIISYEYIKGEIEKDLYLNGFDV